MNRATCYNQAMDTEWKSRLREVIKQMGLSYRAVSLEAGLGENFVQQALASRDPSFSRLARILSVLGPRAAFYVISGARLTTTNQLRAALIGYGVPEEHVDQVVKIIDTYVTKPASERSGQSQPTDQHQRASIHHAQSQPAELNPRRGR